MPGIPSMKDSLCLEGLMGRFCSGTLGNFLSKFDRYIFSNFINASLIFSSIDKEIGGIEAAHESIVWTLAWHPIGHILCSGSNDHTVKFWTRNRPGDQMRDKYNLNTLPASLAGLEDYEMDEHIVIPGMGPEDKIDGFIDGLSSDANNGIIPGLDLDTSALNDKREKEKKVPYSKPIPKNFQAHWNLEPKKMDDHPPPMTVQMPADMPPTQQEEPLSTSLLVAVTKDIVAKMIFKLPGVVPLEKLDITEISIYGKTIKVMREFFFIKIFLSQILLVFKISAGSKLAQVIREGSESLHEYLHSGEIEELVDVLPYEDYSDYTLEDYINDNANMNGNEEDGDNNDDDDENSMEPDPKRFRGDSDNFSMNDDSRDNMYNFSQSNSFQNQKGNSNSGGIPSLLNLNIEPPKMGNNGSNSPDRDGRRDRDRDRDRERDRERRTRDRSERKSRWSRF